MLFWLQRSCCHLSASPLGRHRLETAIHEASRGIRGRDGACRKWLTLFGRPCDGLLIPQGLPLSAPSVTHRVRSSSFVVYLVHLVSLVQPNKQKQPDGLHVSRGTYSFVT